MVGPSGGIPNSTISTRLYGLYSGTTSGLLTGIAMHEATTHSSTTIPKWALPACGRKGTAWARSTSPWG